MDLLLLSETGVVLLYLTDTELSSGLVAQQLVLVETQDLSIVRVMTVKEEERDVLHL